MSRNNFPDFSIFYKWHSPAELRDLCFGVRAALDLDCGEFANVINHGLQPLLDAQTAADYGIIYGQFNPGILVRLCRSPQPDFQVRVGTRTPQWFEATEALPAGRRRAEEYKSIRALPEDKRGWVHVNDEELAADHNTVAEVLQERLREKEGRTYRDANNQLITPNLLVRDSLAHNHSNESLARIASPWRDAYPSIWILRPDARLVRLFPSLILFASRDGIQSLLPVRPQRPLKLW